MQVASIRITSNTLHYCRSPIRSLRLLNSDRPFSTLASPTKPSFTDSKHSNPSNSRAQLIARHLSISASNDSKMSKSAGGYTVRKIAPPNTLEHRIYIEKDGVPISPFHDIPLYANEQQTLLNMVVEIPRWTNGKLEV